jgi:uncharacterized protein (TIGR00730 family)
VVAVFGASRREDDSDLYREAYALGQGLARAGYTVLNGGYGGSMAAVSRGAYEAGGHVVGVTCAIFDPLLPNRWLHEEIKEPDLMARLRTIIDRADAYVALRGGIGTLCELTLAWSLLQTRSFARPLVLLGDDWRHVVAAFRAHTDMGDAIASLARIVDTPAQVLSALSLPPPQAPEIPRPAG